MSTRKQLLYTNINFVNSDIAIFHSPNRFGCNFASSRWTAQKSFIPTAWLGTALVGDNEAR